MEYRTRLFSDRDFLASAPIEEAYHDTLESVDDWIFANLCPGYTATVERNSGAGWEVVRDLHP